MPLVFQTPTRDFFVSCVWHWIWPYSLCCGDVKGDVKRSCSSGRRLLVHHAHCCSFVFLLLSFLEARFSLSAVSLCNVRPNVPSLDYTIALCLQTSYLHSTPPFFWQVVLQMRSNAVAWNPQEPMNFVCANEDTNLYTFDLRNLNQVNFQ